MKNKLTCSLLLALPVLFIKTCTDLKVAPCYSPEKIAQLWKNDYTVVQDCNSKNVVVDSYRIYPSGIFKLNKDGTYNVVSGEVPLDGKWAINADCSMTLDNNNSNKRTFTIVKLSADSLVLSRKDNATLTVYIQHYAR